LYKLVGNERHEAKNQNQPEIKETVLRSTRFPYPAQLIKNNFLKQKAWLSSNNQLNNKNGPNIQSANENMDWQKKVHMGYVGSLKDSHVYAGQQETNSRIGTKMSF